MWDYIAGIALAPALGSRNPDQLRQSRSPKGGRPSATRSVQQGGMQVVPMCGVRMFGGGIDVFVLVMLGGHPMMQRLLELPAGISFVELEAAVKDMADEPNRP